MTGNATTDRAAGVTLRGVLLAYAILIVLAPVASGLTVGDMTNVGFWTLVALVTRGHV